MTLEALLHDVKPGAELMIANQPFVFAGKAKVELDGGDIRYWIFDKESAMLAVSPEDEEVVYFRMAHEDVVPEDEMVTYEGVDYEFSYEDAGVVAGVEGETDVDEEIRYGFVDYEAENGSLVRIVTNEDTEDKMSYSGSVVVEDDIMFVE